MYYYRQHLIVMAVIDTPPGTSDEHLSTLMALSNAKPDGVRDIPY